MSASYKHTSSFTDTKEFEPLAAASSRLQGLKYVNRGDGAGGSIDSLPTLTRAIFWGMMTPGMTGNSGQ
jgi:hypothetical protein